VATSSNGKTVLLIEDDGAIADVYKAYLTVEGYEVTHVENGEDALSALTAQVPDAVLLDLKLPDMSGFDILENINANQIPTGVVVVTGEASMKTAIDAMKLGARDFVVKPCDKNRLLLTVQNVIENQQLKEIVETYRGEIDRHSFNGFIGSSLSMQAIYRTIESAAKSKASVFITGESGTGKEVCAEAIHRGSERSKNPFVALNCGAIPKDLVESEIFGHVKGAFTGAASDRVGLAGQADGGTLFLDEICEMELSLQPKLLRFLQTGVFQRVGASKTEEVDVRIVCATNRNPWLEVSEGRFREDLYYRLHVLPIELPPLRERDADVVEIASHFLGVYSEEEGKSFNTFAPEVEASIQQFPWPGNVRQLQNVIRNIVVLNDGDIVTPEMLPAPLDASIDAMRGGQISPVAPISAPVANVASSTATDEIRPLEELETEAIRNAIRLCDGNIPEAAFKLGISAATIYRKKVNWKEEA
jgi:two-component system repressor protein LuxO